MLSGNHRSRTPRSTHRRVARVSDPRGSATQLPSAARPRRRSAVREFLLGPRLRISEIAKEKVNPVEGLSALSLDALTSVAYGPQAILLVLATAGVGALHLVVPITIAIVVLLAILVVSYQQVISAYPGGGGAYAVSRANLGHHVSQVAAAALVVDYTLTVAVSISAGVQSLVSAFPALEPGTVPLCLGILVMISLLNLRGLGDSARAFLLPTLLFIVGLLAVIAVGLIHPIAQGIHQPGTSVVATHSLEAIGVVLVLKAFSAGCSALTGVEAIANGVPQFKEPRVHRAKTTEALLGVILGAMLLGLAVLIQRFRIEPHTTQTVLSQVMATALGRNWAYYLMSVTVTIVLALAANTSFGGLPILGSLLARDNYVPHLFALRDERLTFGFGISVLTLFAAALLIGVEGNTNTLIPLFAIGVFTGFTLAQSGLVVHWWRSRPTGWRLRASINGLGAVVTGAATLIFLTTKFTEGAWLVVVAIPAFILLFRRVHSYYERISQQLAIGSVPAPPAPRHPTVVVPIQHISTLARRAISEAIAMSDEVIAVHVAFQDEDATEYAVQLEHQWAEWNPGPPLKVLRTEYASVVEPLVAFIDELRTRECQMIVLIPIVHPRRWQHRILHNHLDLVLASELRKRSDVVVARVAMDVDD